MKIHVCCLFVFIDKTVLSHKFKCFPACTVEEAVEYISHIFGSGFFFSTAFGWSEDYRLSFFILVRKMHYRLLSRFLD